MRITKEYTFDAAHHLPHVEAGHPCGRVHGHTYRVELVLEGPVDAQYGWVQDYGEISEAFKPLMEAELDHHDLNDVLPNPTAEALALFLGKAMARFLPLLVAVTVRETPTSSATWERT